MTRYPVIEIFGPVVQGEGKLAGAPTHFVRFGGCDYRCSWCDSMYAVDPAEVRANATKLTAEEIAAVVVSLDGKPDWVTLSGGNPALLELGPLLDALDEHDFWVSVETQGSRWKDWLGRVECLTVSPKPPSSGMVTDRHDDETARFMELATDRTVFETRCLKIVVFDEADLDWAEAFIGQWREWPAWLSVGTEQPDPAVAHLSATREATIMEVSDRYAWLCEQVVRRPALAHVRIFPQLHVLAFGHARAV